MIKTASGAAVGTATGDSMTGLERALNELAKLPRAPIITTCYLNVDGAQRLRPADYLEAFGVLEQHALQRAEAEEPALQDSVQRDVAVMRRWLEGTLERSRTRGVAFVACAHSGLFRALELPVPVRDQIVVAQRPNLLQLETLLAASQRFAVALVDHEKLRLLEYRLGELSEYPALFEGPSPHRDRQRGWNVSPSPSNTGGAATRWAPAGSHVDRHELTAADRHIASCSEALSAHLDRHPADHLLLGGPNPERARLEHALPERHRVLVAGHVSVRVSAAFGAVLHAVENAVRDVEDRDDEVLTELEAAAAQGTAVLGLPAVLAALSAGRARELVMAAALEGRPGATCTSCHALWLLQPRCAVCGAATEPVDDIVEAAIERATISGVRVHIARSNGASWFSEGVGAMTRY